jgi:hypothetical protein
MTKQRDFKELVRDRMAKTGERYTAARFQILSKLDPVTPTAEFPGLLSGYDRFGGVQGDTAVLHNVLRHAGITSPITGRPFTEAMIHGLCGGTGFLYAVFEYKGWPPILTLVMRSRTMADLFVAAGVSRLGIRVRQSQTTSPKAARKALDDALAAGKAAVCTADIASLPYYGLPEEFAGAGPHTIAVVGRDGDDVWLDDRSAGPIRMNIDQLGRARARYRNAKNRLFTIEGPEPKHDARKAIRDAIDDTARSFVEPPLPKSFWVNCGFSGLDKWRQMLTDQKDKKGWPQVFAEGPRAYAGLQRAYECIEYSDTAPHGGRPFYADFLEEAAAALDRPTLKKAAAVYRSLGELRGDISRLIADCSDPTVRRACEIADRRLELADAAARGALEESADLWQKRNRLGAECRMTAEAALSLYARMAEVVGKICDAERAAVDLLKQAAH